MELLKKALAVLLAVVIMIGIVPLSPPALAAQVFNDIGGHWAQNDIMRINDLGALADFPAGNFRPDVNITRAEYFSIIVRTLGATEPADIERFADLEPDTWQHDIAAIAHNMGIANGFEDSTMRPNINLTRQDAVTLAARALGMSSTNDWTLAQFTDSANVAAYARTYVSSFVERGLMNGYPDGSLGPTRPLTRAEAVRLISNLFPNINRAEAPFHGVSLQGGLLAADGTELRDIVLHGDLVIGDGVGNGSVLISNSTIYGRVVIRGGGSNTITISNTYVDGVYVASFGQHTRIAVTDDSVVPDIQSVSGFTLSGSGISSVTILDEAREGAIVDLNGVSLDNLHIGGRGAEVDLITGRVLNTRFDGAGQNSSLHLSAGTSVENLAIAAPNVSITGEGSIRNLLVNDSGATVVQQPDFLTVGVNLSANIAGEVVTGPESGTVNMVNRAGDSSLAVYLLPSVDGHSQITLGVTNADGHSATEVRVTQEVSGRIELTERNNNRYAYWIGFFVPSPRAGSTDRVSLTYTMIDGDPITMSNVGTSTRDGQRGLVIHLPVFRRSGTETGQLNETLYINWGGGVTENLQFMSTILSLRPLTSGQRSHLEDEFNNQRFFSISNTSDTPSFTGAEAVRRILNSDNPLGLPSTGNQGLDALNRAISSGEVKNILEEASFARDLTVNTTSNSAYARLSEQGKVVVADAVLNGRRTPYTNAAAVKTVFDNAVNARLAAESALLTRINASGDHAELRRLIETASNAAILNLQTGADPYRSYPSSQRDNMARWLRGERPETDPPHPSPPSFPYTTLDAVIRAIARYLAAFPSPAQPGPGDITVTGATANPTRIPISAAAPFAVGNVRTVVLSVIATGNRRLNPDEIAVLNPTAAWLNDNTQPIARVAVSKDTFTLSALRPGTDTLVISVSGREVRVQVTVSEPVAAAGVTVTPKEESIIAGHTLTLRAVMTSSRPPAPATDTLRWTSDDEAVATVDENGIVTGVGPGIATITVQTAGGHTDTSQIRVFRTADDVVFDRTSIVLTPGGDTSVTVYTFSPGRTLLWEFDRSLISSVGSSRSTTDTRVHTARINAVLQNMPDPRTTEIEVTVQGSNPNEENDFSGRAVLEATIRDSTGVTAYLELGSVMYAGQTQQLFIDIEDRELRDQKFFVRVENVLPGTNVARCIQAGTLVGMGDVITIAANDNGVGLARISLFTNRNFTGNPVAPPLMLIVAPQAFLVDDFRHNGTSGAAYTGGNPFAAPGGLIPNDATWGRILPMKLSDTNVRVSAEQNIGGTNVAMPQNSTSWVAYETDSNRETLREVRVNAYTGHIVDGNGDDVLDRGGAPILFDTVFYEDAEYTEIYQPTPTLKYGYFRPTGVSSDVKQRIMRSGGTRQLPSQLFSSVGNGILVPNSARHTGLIAVGVTPARALNDNALVEEWGNLFFNRVPIFEQDGSDLIFNPLIVNQFNSPTGDQSAFVLQRRNGNGWDVVLQGADLRDLRAVRSGATLLILDPADGTTPNPDLRIVDANGTPVPLTGDVPAIVFGNPNEFNNTFHIRLLPAALQRPGNVTRPDPVVWRGPGEFMPDEFKGHEASIGFSPGSRDDYYFEGKLDDNGDVIPMHPITGFPRLVARRAPDSSVDEGVTSLSILELGAGNYFTYIGTEFQDTPVGLPRDYFHRYIIEQHSKRGFAPLRGDGHANPATRQNPEISDTGVPPLEYNFRLVAPTPAQEPYSRMIPLGATRVLLMDDHMRARLEVLNISTSNARFSLISDTTNGTAGFFNALTAGNQIFPPTAPMNIASIFVQPPDTFGGGMVVRITHATNDSLFLTVNIAFAAAGGGAGGAGGSAGASPPSGADTGGAGSSGAVAGVSALALDLPGVAAAAATAGIDTSTAVFESANATMMIIDNDGVATPRRAGRVTVRIRSRDGRRQTQVVVTIAPAGTATAPTPTPAPGQNQTPTPAPGQNQTPTPAPGQNQTPTPTPAPANAVTAIRLRTAANVANGGTVRLEPFLTPGTADRSGLVWSSSDASVASVSGGVVTGHRVGSARITVTDASGRVSASTNVSVRADTRPVTAITMSRQTLTINVGAASSLSVTYRPSNATMRGVTWTSSNEGVARVEPGGRVVGVSAGTATITATSDSGARVATCVVTVRVPVASVSLPEVRITLRVGETYQLNPVVSPSNAVAVRTTFRSRIPNTATVSSSGLITARRVGSTAITVTIDGRSVVCNVVVTN